MIANSYPEMKFLIDERAQSVSCHPQLLTQTLLDLFDNAFDASKEQVQLAIYQDNDFVHFEVINREAVISHDVLSKLGEPFNSTKEQGAGLGLFNAFNSALVMNGTFEIFNKNDSVHALLSLPVIQEEVQA